MLIRQRVWPIQAGFPASYLLARYMIIMLPCSPALAFLEAISAALRYLAHDQKRFLPPKPVYGVKGVINETRDDNSCSRTGSFVLGGGVYSVVSVARIFVNCIKDSIYNTYCTACFDSDQCHYFTETGDTRERGSSNLGGHICISNRCDIGSHRCSCF